MQIQSFDHFKFAAMPEYRDAVVALQNFARALDKNDIAVSFDEWPTVVRLMSEVLFYPDHCDSCGAWDQYPHRGQVKKGWLTGTYRCSDCGVEWNCGYAVNHYRFGE
jgi:hypothetical protein